jgi:two-component system OmpR family response regulator
MPKKVFVVEDDQAIGALIAMVLKYEGYEVILARDYQQVPDSVAESRPDVVLIDSPHARGYGPAWELALSVRQKDSSIPMLMLTGHAQDATEVRMTDHGKLCITAIPKPFDIDNLVSQVQAITRDN